MSDFVIVIDMQKDFIVPDGALPVAGAEEIVAPMREWLAALVPERTSGVLFTADTHNRETYAESPEARLFPPHCIRGTAGWDPVFDPSHLLSDIPRYWLEKNVFDMWAEADLDVTQWGTDRRWRRDDFFSGLRKAGIRTLIVVGVAADYCVRQAVDGMLKKGFEVRIPRDLTRGIGRQIEEVAAQEWQNQAVTII